MIDKGLLELVLSGQKKKIENRAGERLFAEAGSRRWIWTARRLRW